MKNYPKIALGAWARGSDGTFGGDLTADEIAHLEKTADTLGLNMIRFREKEMQ